MAQAYSVKLNHERRKVLGWLLFLSGLASTVPIAMRIFGKNKGPHARLLFSAGQPAIRRAVNDMAVTVVTRAVAGTVPRLLT